MAWPENYNPAQSPQRFVQVDPVTGLDVGAPGSTLASPSYTTDAPGVYLGYQQIVEPATATALAVPAGATKALIQNSGTVTARGRFDGATTPPTANTGFVIPVGPENGVLLSFGEAALGTTRVIRTAAGVTLDITYFR